jgi:hypothetical protein
MGQNKAKQVKTDVTPFDGALSSADVTVQKALETLDEAGDVVKKASTTDATVTAIYSFAIPEDATVVIMVDVAGKRTNGTGRLGHRRRAMAYREGAGAAALQGGVNTPMSKTGGGAGGVWDATIDLSSNTLRVIVTGAAAENIEWTARVSLTVAL